MRRLAITLGLLLSVAACGADEGSSEAPVATTTATTATVTPTDASSTTVVPTTASSTVAGEVVNAWTGTPVDVTKLPIGTDHVSTTTAAVGNLYVCDAGDPNGGGAFAVGPWIDEAAGTWDLTRKVAVQGAVSWPMAAYSETVEGTTRTITSSGVPVGLVTGTFPIAADDPAYAYDRNPNAIATHDIVVSLPVSPTQNAQPGCLSKGPVGILRNGVVVFAPIDATNRDAAAYETQDDCDGHPEQRSTYHYHTVPSCILDASTGPSTVVGFAADGFPIVVERDAAGNLPTNADLDECHGRDAAYFDGNQITSGYHYSVTREFPYFIGCLRGDSAI